MNDANVLVPYLLRFERRRGYLFVRVEGTHDSANLSLHYWDQVKRLCKQLDYHRLLVVERLRRQISLNDAFDFACRFDYEAFEGVRIAFVDLLPKHADINEFTAGMSVRHGLDVKIFNDVAPAKQWLLSG